MNLFNKTLTLQRPTPSTDSVGGAIEGTFTNIVSNIGCAIWPASAKTVEDFARRDLFAITEIAVPNLDIGAQSGDRILIDSKYYNVIGYMPYENPDLSTSIYLVVTGRRNQP